MREAWFVASVKRRDLHGLHSYGRRMAVRIATRDDKTFWCLDSTPAPRCDASHVRCVFMKARPQFGRPRRFC